MINKPEILQARGPLLLAANHPNSFLDGVIISTLFKHKVYSLARGDVFRNKKAANFLKKLHLLPIYRSTESTAQLDQNYVTFSACHDVFSKKRIVLIFSEGYCLNEWHLRPLKKGTARLAISSWEKGLDVTVIPLGFNYNSFCTFGKNVYLNFGNPLNKKEILDQPSDGKQLLSFNRQLQSELENLVYEIEPGDRKRKKELLYAYQATQKKLLLAIPALAGWLIHVPFYYPIRFFTRLKFNNEFYDAVIVSLTFVFYPFYILLVGLLLFFIVGWVSALSCIILMPFCAWACVQLKNQLD